MNASRGPRGLWRKPAITIIGGLVCLAGVVMLVTPGPGLVTIAAGLAILATEYEWAERQLDRAKAKLRQATKGRGRKGDAGQGRDGAGRRKDGSGD